MTKEICLNELTETLIKKKKDIIATVFLNKDNAFGFIPALSNAHYEHPYEFKKWFDWQLEEMDKDPDYHPVEDGKIEKGLFVLGFRYDPEQEEPPLDSELDYVQWFYWEPLDKCSERVEENTWYQWDVEDFAPQEPDEYEMRSDR
jgi:hypothetical protein